MVEICVYSLKSVFCHHTHFLRRQCKRIQFGHQWPLKSDGEANYYILRNERSSSMYMNSIYDGRLIDREPRVCGTNNNRFGVVRFPPSHTHTISNAHTVLELYWIRLLSIVWVGIDHAFTQFNKREKTTIQRPRNERGWKCV